MHLYHALTIAGCWATIALASRISPLKWPLKNDIVISGPGKAYIHLAQKEGDFMSMTGIHSSAMVLRGDKVIYPMEEDPEQETSLMSHEGRIICETGDLLVVVMTDKDDKSISLAKIKEIALASDKDFEALAESSGFKVCRRKLTSDDTVQIEEFNSAEEAESQEISSEWEIVERPEPFIEGGDLGKGSEDEKKPDQDGTADKDEAADQDGTADNLPEVEKDENIGEDCKEEKEPSNDLPKTEQAEDLDKKDEDEEKEPNQDETADDHPKVEQGENLKASSNEEEEFFGDLPDLVTVEDLYKEDEEEEKPNQDENADHHPEIEQSENLDEQGENPEESNKKEKEPSDNDLPETEPAKDLSERKEEEKEPSQDEVSEEWSSESSLEEHFKSIKESKVHDDKRSGTRSIDIHDEKSDSDESDIDKRIESRRRRLSRHHHCPESLPSMNSSSFSSSFPGSSSSSSSSSGSSSSSSSSSGSSSSSSSSSSSGSVGSRRVHRGRRAIHHPISSSSSASSGDPVNHTGSLGRVTHFTPSSSSSSSSSSGSNNPGKEADRDLAPYLELAEQTSDPLKRSAGFKQRHTHKLSRARDIPYTKSSGSIESPEEISEIPEEVSTMPIDEELTCPFVNNAAKESKRKLLRRKSEIITNKDREEEKLEDSEEEKLEDSEEEKLEDSEEEKFEDSKEEKLEGSEEKVEIVRLNPDNKVHLNEGESTDEMSEEKVNEVPLVGLEDASSKSDSSSDDPKPKKERRVIRIQTRVFPLGSRRGRGHLSPKNLEEREVWRAAPKRNPYRKCRH